jgi:hypothetical protein
VVDQVRRLLASDGVTCITGMHDDDVPFYFLDLFFRCFPASLLMVALLELPFLVKQVKCIRRF